MITAYIDDRAIKVNPLDPFGEGGEGVAFLIDGKTLHATEDHILKLYRGKNDPIYLVPGNPELQKRNQLGAVSRLKAHQSKLPAFPKGLPDRVVGPSKLAWSARTGSDTNGKRRKPKVIGYLMPFIKGNVMSDFADIDFREIHSVDNNQIRDIHLDWLTTIEKCHPKGLVFGDVNNNNQIVTSDGKVYVIDADAAQWSDGSGKMYFCETFTPRFVDPLICKPDELVMKAPHSKETDLYAFDLIFWSTTLYVGPWEGALPLKTKDPKVAGIRPNERALRRVSVFHPDVKYPTWATHFRCLPDDILHHYDLLLHKDVRGKSMRKLLENLRWTNCSSCGFYHARTSCPNCAAPSAPEITVASITKDLVIEKVVDLGSTKILSACFQGGKLRYLYQKGDEFKREFGSIGLTKSLDRDFEYAICGNKTIVSMNGTAVCFSPNENPRRLQAERFRGKSPQYAGNETDIFYLRGGHLIKESNSIEGDFVDETLSNQTLLWVGDTFGIAFYFVGGLQKVKVFKTEEKGSVSVQNMPDLQGTLRHASVYFSKSKAWLFVTTEDKGVLTNNCFIIRKNGECSSSLSVEQGSPDHTWLSGFIHLGKCAAQLKSGSGQRIECLLAATDEGVVGIMEQNGKLIEAMKFEGTKGVVLPTDRLLYDEVLYRIRGGQVHTIRSK